MVRNNYVFCVNLFWEVKLVKENLDLAGLADCFAHWGVLYLKIYWYPSQ
jgi:hypothetical protein